MQNVLFKYQLLRANSRPELNKMTLALEPLLNLCDVGNTYRGGEFDGITSIISQLSELMRPPLPPTPIPPPPPPPPPPGVLLMNNGFDILVSLFSFNLVQKIVITAATAYVLKQFVISMVSAITKLAFDLLGQLLKTGLKITVSVFKVAREILVFVAILLVILHLLSQTNEIKREVEPYLAPCMTYVESMLETMQNVTVNDVIPVTMKASEAAIEMKKIMITEIMQAQPSDIVTNYTSKLWTLLQENVHINVSSVGDIVTQINSGEPIVTLKSALPVLSAEVIVVLELLRLVRRR